jgi:cardiolipin synthase
MDGFGCAKLKGRTVKRLKNCGQVVVFHKLCPLSPKNINCRDHRKIAVVDGVVAFTGGINIADEYANLSSPHGYWKDCGVAFYGQAAAAFADEFLYALNKNGVTKLDGSTNNLSLAIKAGQLLPIFDSPLSGGGLFEDVLSTLINRAQRGICICTPYLCVGDKLKSALIFAARRGVDVKIIIPATPDKKLTYMLTKNFASTLVAGGVEVYAYTPGFMHAKYFILDDCALVGSYNLDFRSMHLNCECAAMFANEALVSKVKGDFNECLRLSSTFVPQKTNLATRVFNCILQLFAPLA